MGLLDWWRSRTRDAVPAAAASAGHDAAKPEVALDAAGSSRLELAGRLLSAGDHAAAMTTYAAALDAGEDALAAHVGHARACAASGGRLEEALDSLEVSIALDPACVDALGLLAQLRLETGATEEAVRHLRLALELSAHRPDLCFLLGYGLNRIGDTGAAMAAYQKAIALDPEDPAPRVNLGLIYLDELGEPKRAVAEFRGALQVAPKYVSAMANLGLALHDLGRHAEAQAMYRQGLALAPDSVELRWNRGVNHLCLGRYAEGWKDYELRFRRFGGRDLSAFQFPDWDGSPLPNGRLLVLAEQGLGDEIRFASCLPDLHAMSVAVVLECAPRLAGLFQRSFPWAEVRGAERTAPADWLRGFSDIRAKISVGTLPGLLRPALDHFPRHDGYLRADPAKACDFRRRMAAEPGVLHVGLSWRGGTRKTRGAIRSLPLERVLSLCDLPNVRLVCLQHDVSQEERSAMRSAGIVVWDEALGSIDAAAALIDALDAVVSVPNTNANLAGALGKRMWVMLNASPDWYWRPHGGGSPWYPAATLVQAVDHGDWSGVIGRVRSELCEWAQGTTAADRPC